MLDTYRCVWCGRAGDAIHQQVVKVGPFPTGWVPSGGIPKTLWQTMVRLKANMLYLCYGCGQPVKPGSHEDTLVPAWMWPDGVVMRESL